ncbi:serine hydrolase [Pseudorhodoferax aquiterrae]|uniref:Serine hydrolase n=1 Tax=Pseudorhodoferax aquiterrae TaxID=747304 RepID=A0ABQ3G990_9BURK|nr:serine hydrolase domain-containing protein [Pseudorhodoferax aquiterrae]GHC96960.1 serine hydrolase [Pseudorhodoferax aquiterrae]
MARLNAPALTQLNQVLQQHVDAGLLPGAVVLVGQGGQVAHQAALGRLDPAGQQAMPADAIFRIYSMTKPIVSLAALMLAEQGRLSLADPITRWLPQFAETPVGVERDGALVLERALRPPTVHDLLRHTAGFTYEFLGNSAVQRQYQAAGLADTGRTNAGLCDALARLPYSAQPGSCWQYSRATDVLGALLEVVAGEPLGTLLQRLILGPLGMVDTGFSVPPAQQHRIAEPFALCPETGQNVVMLDARRAPAFESGGGGLVSTAADYLRFVQLLRNQGRVEGAGGERLVARKTIEWMVADHLGSIPVAGELLAPGHGFGLGVAVRTAPGLVAQPGSPGMYFWSGIGGTFFFVDPAEDVFAVLLAQTPNQRIFFRNLFRHLVYAAIE